MKVTFNKENPYRKYLSFMSRNSVIFICYKITRKYKVYGGWVYGTPFEIKEVVYPVK